MTVQERPDELIRILRSEFLSQGDAVTDDHAIHDNVSGEIDAITEKDSPVDADIIIIEDSEASNAKKKVQLSNLPGGGGTDEHAIHDNVASEISAITEKTAPVGADLLIIEDSEASNAKKKLQIANVISGILTAHYPRFVQITAGAVNGTPVPLTPFDPGVGGAGVVEGEFSDDIEAAATFRAPIDYVGDLFIVPMATWDFWGAGSSTPVLTTSYRVMAPSLTYWPPTLSNDLYQTDTGGSNHTMNFSPGAIFGNVGVRQETGFIPKGDVVTINKGSFVTCRISKPGTTVGVPPKYFRFVGFWIVYGSAWAL